MTVGGLILVDPSLGGNIGAAMRVAANFGVPRLELVRPAVPPDDNEVLRWACGAEERVLCRSWQRFADASGGYHTLAASASGRGRRKLPVLSPSEAFALLSERGLDGVALVFGNETRGLARDDLDRCDLVLRIPTEEGFPVLNLAQAVAILVAQMAAPQTASESRVPQPAPQEEIDGLMGHLGRSLLTVGFLDPGNPQRILRQLRRLFGRAGITSSEVKILRGICRQMEWAARENPGRFARAKAEGTEKDDECSDKDGLRIEN